ncbi:diguanylate cyclase domain-containing protein [Haliovirga abyssi]|uniref:GGDEF domain-containing protein n=1 Tax=Haliovirga abyssi TaxID=2996794 RepID=A0AAU9DIF6_9FUSO|nr:diguanylate cyclase [Haliovirga abyssi]BDU50549.1 hypothetical protein HLVA_11180 [Haliovirga abyssi]
MKNILFLSDNDFLKNYLSGIGFNLLSISECKKNNLDLIIVSEKRIDEVERIERKDINDIHKILLLDTYTKVDEIKSKILFPIDYFILKDDNLDEILKKIDNSIELIKIKKEKKFLLDTIKELNDINNRLIRKSQTLEDELNTDELANVYNRNFLIKRLQEELERVKRHDRNFAVAIIDIRELKVINKKYGYLIGDEVIKKVSKITSETIRNSDVLGRLSGNIFMVILPEIIEKYAVKVIERIINKVELTKIKDINLSVNCGFVLIKKDNIEEFSESNKILNILNKLIYYSKKIDQKIVEYKDENMNAIEEIENIVGLDEVEEEHNVLWEELNKSKKFIKNLLPKYDDWSEKINFGHLYLPFNFIGGDFFDFIEIDEDKTAIIFCDVSGHGVSSALYITSIKYIFKDLIVEKKIYEPEMVLDEFNKRILEISKGAVFVVTTYGYIDRKNKKFVFGFGGGTSPIKIDVKEKKMENLVEDGGFAIGLFEEAYFERKEIEIGMDDMILFYSDGIYEFLIENNIVEDDKQFYDIVKNSIDNEPDKFIGNIYKFMQEKTDKDIDFNDDITLLAVRCNICKNDM